MSLQLKSQTGQLNQLSIFIEKERSQLEVLQDKEEMMRNHYQREMALLEQQYGRPVSSSNNSSSQRPSSRQGSVVGQSDVSSVSDLSQIVEGFHQYMHTQFYKPSSAKKGRGSRIRTSKANDSRESMSLREDRPSEESNESFYKKIPSENFVDQIIERRSIFKKQKEAYRSYREQSLEQQKRIAREQLLAERELEASKGQSKMSPVKPQPVFYPYSDETTLALRNRYPYLQRPYKHAKLVQRQILGISRLRNQVRQLALQARTSKPNR